MGIFKRKIKNTFDIARETGIDEEKIKELKNGERHIEGKTMEKVLDAINRSKVDRTIEKAEIFDWYKNTNLKKLRQKFGYEAGLHLAKAIEMDCGTLNRIENKRIDHLTNSIIKLYDFYNNDFNKNIKKTDKKKEDKSYYGKRKKIFEWYKETDLKALREIFGYSSQEQLSKKVNLSTSAISRAERKEYNTLNKTIMMLHKFYQDNSNNINLENNKPNSNENKEDEVAIIPFEYLEKVIVENDNTEPIKAIEEDKDIIIKNLQEENEKLKRQIMLYEKLIERL